MILQNPERKMKFGFSLQREKYKNITGWEVITNIFQVDLGITKNLSAQVSEKDDFIADLFISENYGEKD